MQQCIDNTVPKWKVQPELNAHTEQERGEAEMQGEEGRRKKKRGVVVWCTDYSMKKKRRKPIQRGVFWGFFKEIKVLLQVEREEKKENGHATLQCAARIVSEVVEEEQGETGCCRNTWQSFNEGMKFTVCARDTRTHDHHTQTNSIIMLADNRHPLLGPRGPFPDFSWAKINK